MLCERAWEIIYPIYVTHSRRYLYVNSYNFTTINDSRTSLPLQLLNHVNFLMRACTTRIYTYLKRIEGIKEIQFRARKKRKILVWRATWKYMSFRSTAHTLQNTNTNTNICWWHIAGIAVTPENGELLTLSSLFGTRPVPGVRLSFRLSIYHPLANCHFTDSLFCENRLHSDSNEASFTPCHASYTPLGTRGSSTRQTRGNIAIRPLTLSTLSLSVPYRFHVGTHSNFTFSLRNDQTAVVFSERFASN